MDEELSPLGTGGSCREPLSLATTSRASLVPFKKSLWGSFPLWWGLIWPASLLDIKGPTSAILASTWVRGIQAFPHSLQTLQQPLSVHLLVREAHSEGFLWGTPPLAHSWELPSFWPSEMEWQPVRGCGRFFFFKLNAVFSFCYYQPANYSLE